MIEDFIYLAVRNKGILVRENEWRFGEPQIWRRFRTDFHQGTVLSSVFFSRWNLEQFNRHVSYRLNTVSFHSPHWSCIACNVIALYILLELITCSIVVSPERPWNAREGAWSLVSLHIRIYNWFLNTHMARWTAKIPSKQQLNYGQWSQIGLYIRFCYASSLHPIIWPIELYIYSPYFYCPRRSRILCIEGSLNSIHHWMQVN
jgi:hypothetical protein